MAANLLLCLSQKPNSGYLFKNTGVRVFSFEEALYHVCNYWKQSLDDYLSDELIQWVQQDLELPNIAAKIREVTVFDSLSQRLKAFLSLADYITPEQLKTVQRELTQWERRMEWERLKERGDYMMNNNHAERALPLYRKALVLEERPELFHNAGIALCKLGKYGEAAYQLEKAMRLNPDNTAHELALIEALILDGDYVKAEQLNGELAVRHPELADCLSYTADIEFARGNHLIAIDYYRQAYAKTPDPEYIYRMCNVYIRLRMFDEAISALEEVTVHDKRFLKKQADIYAVSGNMSAAAKSVERALRDDPRSIDLWVRLAKYHRHNLDLDAAEEAISHALEIAPRDARALLEQARLQKTQGYIKDYQNTLHSVLSGFKQEYRDNSVS